jgi:hypothetical protein
VVAVYAQAELEFYTPKFLATSKVSCGDFAAILLGVGIPYFGVLTLIPWQSATCISLTELRSVIDWYSWMDRKRL